MLKRFVLLLLAGALAFPLAAQDQAGTETGAADPRAGERGLWFDGAEGEAGQNVPERGQFQPRSSVFSLIQALFVLALTALAVYGVVAFLKKRPRGAVQNDRYLKLLAATPINAKTAAAVIAVGGKAWLAGVTDSSVSLLAEITDQETVDAMTLEYEQRATAGAAGRALSFAALLRQITGGRQGAARKTDGGGTSQADKLRSYRDRLRGL